MAQCCLSAAWALLGNCSNAARMLHTCCKGAGWLLLNCCSGAARALLGCWFAAAWVPSALLEC
eukprot:6024627-Lingulodinium_polyedra.AAC.1